MISWLIRWGMIGSGVFLMWGGITGWSAIEVLSGQAREMSVSKAAALDGDTSHFVTINSEMDQSQRVFETGLYKPRFTSRDASVVFEIDPWNMSSDEIQSYVGSSVTFTGPLDYRTASAQSTLTRDDQVVDMNQKIIGMTDGDDGLFWVMSPSFDGDAEEQTQDWMNRDEYTGVLCKFADLDTNVPGLSNRADELRNFFASDYDIAISPSAVILLDGSDGPRSATANFWAVPGSDGTLLVKKEDGSVEGGDLTGVLNFESSQGLSGLGTSLGMDLPESIGIIDLDQTGGDLKIAGWSVARLSVVGGAVFLALGGVCVLGARIEEKERVEGLMEIFDELQEDARQTEEFEQSGSDEDELAA